SLLFFSPHRCPLVSTPFPYTTLFRSDRRRALIVLVAAVPTCALGAWGYTMLTGKGAALVIGAMLMASVPLRRLMRMRGLALSSRDRKSTRLNSRHQILSYAVFCLKKK